MSPIQITAHTDALTLDGKCSSYNAVGVSDTSMFTLLVQCAGIVKSLF